MHLVHLLKLSERHPAMSHGPCQGAWVKMLTRFPLMLPRFKSPAFTAKFQSFVFFHGLSSLFGQLNPVGSLTLVVLFNERFCVPHLRRSVKLVCLLHIPVSRLLLKSRDHLLDGDLVGIVLEQILHALEESVLESLVIAKERTAQDVEDVDKVVVTDFLSSYP